MKHLATILLAISLLLSGCGKPTIDTSSDDSMKASIQKVKESLPDDQQETFEEALKIVAFSGVDFSDIFQTGGVDTGATERKMKEALDGKTGEEVIVLAESIQAKREAERIQEEKEEKARANQILVLAEELRKEGDFERALKRYREALSHDPTNSELEAKISEVSRIIEEKRKEKEERDSRVRSLLREARDLQRDENLMDALQRYEEILVLDGDSEEAEEGIAKTKTLIEELQRKQNYLEFIDLYDFEATLIDTYAEKDIPAVRFKLRNNGDRDLDEVTVVVYLRDESGNVIAEEDFHPVLVSGYSFSGNNKPLKAGYIWEMERGKYYTIKDAPSEWDVGNAEAKITDIEFSK